MRNPLKLFAARFVGSSSITLPAAGIFLSVLQFVTFFVAAAQSGSDQFYEHN
jgi:uncharacterized membrane protein YbaN (DUF454 family)